MFPIFRKTLPSACKTTAPLLSPNRGRALPQAERFQPRAICATHSNVTQVTSPPSVESSTRSACKFTAGSSATDWTQQRFVDDARRRFLPRRMLVRQLPVTSLGSRATDSRIHTTSSSSRRSCSQRYLPYHAIDQDRIPTGVTVPDELRRTTSARTSYG